ncbi:MAG: maleylpyruvate isomerase N-terminal domain-containing protein [Ilumatobacteraceae bacterium]
MTDSATSGPTRWIAAAAGEQHRLLDSLEGLEASGDLDVAAASLLPDWTIAHVITHVVNSGDGHLRMLAAAARGEIGVQYPGGREQREGEIQEGARRSAAELLADLRRGTDALEAQWAAMPTWAGTGMSMGGEVPVADLPFLRIREVAIHHIDLGLGATFDGLPAEYLREELRRMEMLWAARQPMGMTQLPSAALHAAPPTRLAWLMGRTSIAGIARAGIY